MVATGTTQVPAVPPPVTTQRAGARHPGPSVVSHAGLAAVSTTDALQVPIAWPVAMPVAV
jgi:hypothetical protein